MIESDEGDVALKGAAPHARTRVVRATGKKQDAQLVVLRLSVIPADRDPDIGRLDAVAGCEFVDDRIHLVE
jgi:hypothetical protein